MKPTYKGRTDSLLTPAELRVMEKKLYEAPVRELVSRQIATLKTDIPAWAETYSYKKLTRRGAAKIWAVAGKDIPLVDEDVEVVTQKIYSIVSGYRIFTREVEASRAQGYPLDATRAATARRAISEVENILFFKGDATYNIKGMLGYTGIQTVDAATVSGATVWSGKTGEEIVADIRTMRTLLNTELGLQADTLLLPTAQFLLLDKPVYKEQPFVTIKKFIMDNGWFTKILEVNDLDSSLNGSSPAVDYAMAIDSSPDVMEILLPQDIMQYEPVKESPFYYNVAVEERYGGILVRYPKGIVRMAKI